MDTSFFDPGIDYESGAFDPGLVSKSAANYGNRRAIISNVRLEDLLKRPRNVLFPGLRYRYCYDVEFLDETTSVSFGMAIKTAQGFVLGGGSNELGSRHNFPAGSCTTVSFHFSCRLAAKTFFLNAGVMGTAKGREREYLHRILDASIFRVEHNYNSMDSGLVRFDTELNVVWR